VFNFDVPHHAEDYVHRIGRTGRAGLEGHAFTIAMPEDRFAVEAIEKLTGHPIPPMIVEGLDPVDWADGDARKRRGRKAPAKAPAAKAPRAKRVEPKRPEPKRPEPKREEPAPMAAVAEIAREEAPRMRAPREEPRHEAPRREAAPFRDRPPMRDDNRERYRRDNDLGPAIVGFGNDIPAFMMMVRRPAPVPETEA
jgi:superfamily II DNA/RNA helicase